MVLTGLAAELRLEFFQEIIGEEAAQLIDIAAIPDLLNRDKLLLSLAQKALCIEVGRNKPVLVWRWSVRTKTCCRHRTGSRRR